jgi:hypothetical protein
MVLAVQKRPQRTALAALGAFVALAALAPSVGRTQAPPPAERGEVHSSYELQTIANVLAELGESKDPHPEGKVVEGIEVVPLDVFEKRDPLPRWLNVFHATTRRSVVRREVLVHEGEPYSQVLVDETIRNLRQLLQLSIVLVVATRGKARDRVRLIVITKDVWSLRLAWDAVVTPGGLESLTLEPEEINLFGTHQTASGNFLLEPSAVTLGLGYTIPRIGGSRVLATTAANVMVNRQSGSVEGSFGSVVAGQPLFSGTTKWAWDAQTSWEDVIFRRYTNASLSTYTDPATGFSIPFQYRSSEYVAKYELRRSFGWDTKHEFTLAAGIVRGVYRVEDPGAHPRTVADFTSQYVPVSDTTVGPSIQYETYTKRYARLIDFDTLALQEDYRLGHDVVLGVAPSFQALGATRTFVRLTASAQYTVALRDGLFRAAVGSLTDVQTDRIPDASILPTAHLVTPTIAGLGRIVVDGQLLYRWRNYLNQVEYLGGDTRIRGYPTSFFAGSDTVSYNVELRSRPVDVLTCQLAGVAFFDAGDAFFGLNDFRSFQSAGVGIRALFPWLDRVVFRADIGFPFERPLDTTGRPIAPVGYLIAFGQAFDVPTVAPTPVLPTEQVEVPAEP